MKFSLTAAALAGLAVASPLVELEERVTCPVGGDLPPNYVSPSLIVEVSKNFPDVKFGATKIPLITPNDLGAIVNLELPPSAYDKICSLVVFFPNHKQTNSFYYYNGPGHFHFTG